MNPKQDEILASFAALIEGAEATLSTCDTSLTGEPTPRDDDYFAFRTQALNLIRRVCGERSNHYDALNRIATENESKNDSSFFPHCLGVLRAAKRDFETGLLFDLRSVMAAEVLGSFLEQAARLLEAKRVAAAASLAGSVLEEVLCRIAALRQIPAEAPHLESLNRSLAAAAVYNELVSKRISDLASLRDAAEEGRTEALRAEDVDDMIRWVRKLAADHLA